MGEAVATGIAEQTYSISKIYYIKWGDWLVRVVFPCSCSFFGIIWNLAKSGTPVARWAPLYMCTPFYPILSKPAMQSLSPFSICGFVDSGFTALLCSVVQ